MKRTISYTRQWLSDWYRIFTRELKHIFSDSGVLVIFFLAGLAYPVLYGLIYGNSCVDDMPVAMVDCCGSSGSREFTRKLDATRELHIAYSCADLPEARRLMQQRKVKGAVLIPSDYEECLASGRQAHVSTYADMSSFLYYKNLTMAVNMVMLDKMHGSRPAQPVKYEENLPYNRTFAYNVFFLSAVLLLVIQQTMFYGMSMLTGTMREENRSFSIMPVQMKGRGISRTVAGRGAAYWLIYMAIGVYIAILTPAMFGMPRNSSFQDIFVLLLFYVSACVVFSMTFSSFIRHRETVFVLFLFMSPICLFLTGFSWPESSFPGFWKAFSWLFPSTFAVKAFINMNTAGAGLALAAPQLIALTIQVIVYYLLSCLSYIVDAGKCGNGF